MEKKLEKYGLKVRWNDSNDPDKEPIDFSVEDEHDNVAWVWGNEPWCDVQCECNHPTDHGCVEFGDDDEYGECLLCGAQCLWHWEEGEEYEGTDDDGYVVSSKYGSRVIDEWYHATKIGGIIGDYLKELQEKW